MVRQSMLDLGNIRSGDSVSKKKKRSGDQK